MRVNGTPIPMGRQATPKAQKAARCGTDVVDLTEDDIQEDME